MRHWGLGDVKGVLEFIEPPETRQTGRAPAIMPVMATISDELCSNEERHGSDICNLCWTNAHAQWPAGGAMCPFLEWKLPTVIEKPGLYRPMAGTEDLGLQRWTCSRMHRDGAKPEALSGWSMALNRS
jgi:hypothetical protein